MAVKLSNINFYILRPLQLQLVFFAEGRNQN